MFFCYSIHGIKITFFLDFLQFPKFYFLMNLIVSKAAVGPDLSDQNVLEIKIDQPFS